MSIKKRKKLSSLLMAGGYSCSLDVLRGGPGMTVMQFFDQKNLFLLPILLFLVIKSQDPGPDPH
jgi:hypothetical protein